MDEAAHPRDPAADPELDLHAAPDSSEDLTTLRAALATRTVTGQAPGIMASAFDISTTQAWQLLREMSNLANVKARDVAVIVVASHDKSLSHQDIDLVTRVTAVITTALEHVRRGNQRPTP